MVSLKSVVKKKKSSKGLPPGAAEEIVPPAAEEKRVAESSNLKRKEGGDTGKLFISGLTPELRRQIRLAAVEKEMTLAELLEAMFGAWQAHPPKD